jgi:hypothetical protein
MARLPTLRASNAAGRQDGRLPAGSGCRLPLKPRPCRVFTLRASIPDAALAGSFRSLESGREL